MCNVKFKKYDKVVLVRDFELQVLVIKKGTSGIVLDNSTHPFVQFNTQPHHILHNAEGLGENGRCFTVYQDELELISNYKQSNRHKLHQAIKATGFHAEKLSLATGKAKNYFVGITAESRFIKHGDIKKERLTYLLTMLAFAERDLRNIGNKTIGDKSKNEKFLENTFLNDEEIKLMNSSEYKKVADDFEYGMKESIGESKDKLCGYYMGDKKPKLSNFTKVGIIATVILLLILIVKNLVV